MPQTREQIAEYQRLRDLIRDLVDVSEKTCEARIENRKTEDDSKNTSLAAQLARDAAVEVDALLGSGASDGMNFEAIETAVRRQVMGLAARVIEQRLNADTSDYAGPSLSKHTGRTQAGTGLLSLSALPVADSVRAAGIWESRRPACLPPPSA